MKNIIHTIAFILVIIGGLNWGLIGLSGFDLVVFIFEPLSLMTRLIYILVGLSAMWLLITAFLPDKKEA